MSWLRDLLQVYARVGRRAIELTARHWWLALVAIAYELASYEVLPLLAMPFGPFGGFVIAIGFAALASSGLVLLAGVVRQGRVLPADVPGSFGVYLLDVLTFGFLLWALRYIAGVAFADLVYARIVFRLSVLVFLSAVPEQIYLAGESGAAVFVGSYQFVAAYWIEWLPPAAALFVVWTAASELPIGAFAIVLDGLALTFMGVYRGLLFLELTTSSRRAREFQRRAMGG